MDVFNGHYIDFDVLKENDLVSEKRETARLTGFELVVRLLANLVRSNGGIVYGIIGMPSFNGFPQWFVEHIESFG